MVTNLIFGSWNPVDFSFFHFGTSQFVNCLNHDSSTKIKFQEKYHFKNQQKFMSVGRLDAGPASFDQLRTLQKP